MHIPSWKIQHLCTSARNMYEEWRLMARIHGSPGKQRIGRSPHCTEKQVFFMQSVFSHFCSITCFAVERLIKIVESFLFNIFFKNLPYCWTTYIQLLLPPYQNPTYSLKATYLISLSQEILHSWFLLKQLCRKAKVNFQKLLHHQFWEQFQFPIHLVSLLKFSSFVMFSLYLPNECWRTLERKKTGLGRTLFITIAKKLCEQ